MGNRNQRGKNIRNRRKAKKTVIRGSRDRGKWRRRMEAVKRKEGRKGEVEEEGGGREEKSKEEEGRKGR